MTIRGVVQILDKNGVAQELAPGKFSDSAEFETREELDHSLAPLHALASLAGMRLEVEVTDI